MEMVLIKQNKKNKNKNKKQNKKNIKKQNEISFCF